MIKNQAQAIIPTDWGDFKMIAYSENSNDWMPHIAMIHSNTDLNKSVAVRVHSECLTGDLFHSKRCECGQQLNASMNFFSEHGGILIYLRQEGRNIGIINKLKAYHIQNNNHKNTAEANIELGLPIDARSFDVVIDILHDLNVSSIFLLTNNPDKIKIIKNSSIILQGRIPLEIKVTKETKDYLEIKKNVFNHLLSFK